MVLLIFAQHLKDLRILWATPKNVDAPKFIHLTHGLFMFILRHFCSGMIELIVSLVNDWLVISWSFINSQQHVGIGGLVFSLTYICVCVHWNHTGSTGTFDSLLSNSESAFQATISKTCWRHLLKQPCVWWVKVTKHLFLVVLTCLRMRQCFLSLFVSGLWFLHISATAVHISHFCHGYQHSSVRHILMQR